MLLFVNTLTDTKAEVRTIHYKPELLTEEKRSQGILVDSIPKPMDDPTQIAKLFINPQTKELFYEYEAAQIDPLEEENAQLKEEISNLNGRIAELESQLNGTV